jgi:hypothetical protein
MKTPANKLRSLFALLFLCSALFGFAATAAAQEPNNDPAANEVIDRKTGQLKAKQSPSLPDQMQLMNRRSTQLIQFLQSEVVAYFSAWTERMAQALAALLILFSFLRVWRENSGRGANLFWWFGRLAICLGLIGAGPAIINDMYDIGKDIAEGSSGNSVLARFYNRTQANFSESYAKIALGTFTVKVNKQDFVVTPEGGGDAFLGVLYDQESTIRDFNNRLNDSAYMLPKLFAWLGACRGILEGGDIWLSILAGVLLLAFKILAPFMIVVSIDQKLAQRVSYPFLWGVIVLTLIWPAVSYFIRGLAYLFGNVAMAMGDAAPVYAWNEATLQAFRGAQSQPVYTVLFACFTMTVTALCLWVSPVIAYQISMGRVYEGVSNAASSWAGAVVGTVAEWYSANAAAKLNREAAAIQAQAGFESETTRAGGERQAADLAARARQEAALGHIKGSQVTQLGQIYAARSNQLLTAQAGMVMGINSATAAAALAKNDIARQTNQQIGEFGIARQEKLTGIEADRASDTKRWLGDKVMMGSAYAGYMLRNEGRELLGGKGEGESGGSKAPLAVRGAATAIEIGGSAYGLYKQYGAIQDRAAGHVGAVDQATQARILNQQQAQAAGVSNQDQYLQQMTGANQQYAKDLSGAANTSASQSAGAVTRGSAIQVSAVNRSTAMELQGNQVRYDAQVQAADITREAAIESARLHAMERVLSAVGNKIARDIERGMEMRF